MKLKKLVVNNFRGVGHAEIDLENFTTLIGPNNIGKSTILHAIHLVLDNKKPKLEDWPNQEVSDKSLEIICELGEIEEWEKNKPAISGLLYDGKLILRVECRWKEDGESYTWEYSIYHSLEEYSGKGENFTNAKKDDFLSPILQEMGITKATDYNSQQDEILEFIKTNYIESVELNTDWHLKKFQNSLQQAIPHVMYVPASFKIEDDLKSTSTTSPFAFLFKNKLFPKVKNDDSYTEYIEKTTHLQDKLKGKNGDGEVIDGLGEALEQISGTLNKILDFDSQVRLSVGDIDIEPLFMKAATFLIDEEIETSLQYQGSGVQRALAFAMLESNAEVESEVEGEQRSVVVLYEEPELYIHPHLMRRLKSTLEKRSESSKWQVVCSTHSPFLVNIADKPESLKLIKRDERNNRVVHQITADIFEKEGEYDERSMLRATIDFHPTVCESFFAKRVLIVEGDTEVAIFSMAEQLLEKFEIQDNYAQDITVISAGGKWTIPAISRVLNGLNIEYRIMHDTDRKGLTDAELEEKIAIHPFKANAKIAEVAGAENIFLVDDTFEHILWDASAGESAQYKDKPYNSWKRIRDYLKGDLELTEKSKATLKEVLEFAFCK